MAGEAEEAAEGAEEGAGDFWDGLWGEAAAAPAEEGGAEEEEEAEAYPAEEAEADAAGEAEALAAEGAGEAEAFATEEAEEAEAYPAEEAEDAGDGDGTEPIALDAEAEDAAVVAAEGEPTAESSAEAQAPVKYKVSGQVFAGLVHKVGPKTGNMLVKSAPVSNKYGLEAMILKGNNPAGAKLCDKITFKVVERDGQRPLATSVRVVGKVDRILPDKGLGKGAGSAGTKGAAVVAKGAGAKGAAVATKGAAAPAKGKAGAKGAAVAAKGTGAKGAAAATKGAAAPAKGKGGGKADASKQVAFAGVVSRQAQEPPHKYFIECENITAGFGHDAWFLPSDRPANVDVGSLVAFAVAAGGRALWVCRLAPLADRLWSISDKKQASGGKAGGGNAGNGVLGVRKTIAKKGEGKAKAR